MMDRQAGCQEPLFYAFRLEDRVPADHLLRRIDRVLDLGDLHGQLAGFYSHTGRPSIDPELMMRMLIVGYCHAIRSERRLCDEVSLNLTYRWFCRLGLDDAVPDHSMFLIAPTALATGMRRGELCGLRWRDVDFEASKLQVERSVRTPVSD
jgi:hypothetical protein